MGKRIEYAQAAEALARRNAEIEEKYGAYCSVQAVYSVDSMRVHVDYVALVGRVEYFTRGEEHIFVQTKVLPDRTGMKWDEVRESPYAIRDAFFDVETVGQAIEFLQKTGTFSPLRQRLTWTEFRRWQAFARLAQEHEPLSAAMQRNEWSGDCGEALKALTGIYPSSFFDGCEDGLYFIEKSTDDSNAELRRFAEVDRDYSQATSHEEWLKGFENERQHLRAAHQREEWERKKAEEWRDLWQWFVRPPVSVRWEPINEEAEQKVFKQHIDPATGLGIPIPDESPIMRGGSMMEFLLPRHQLVPVLLIQPKCALEAIAAAIYAERIQGITSRKCDGCGKLFKIGRHKDKRYCGETCKGTAQKQRYRASLRGKKEKARKAARVRRGR